MKPNFGTLPRSFQRLKSSHFEEGTQRCSQNYEHPQHESESVALTMRSIARIWPFAQIVAVIAFHTAHAQVVDMSAQVLQLKS